MACSLSKLYRPSNMKLLLVLPSILATLSSPFVFCHLHPDFYSDTCPHVASIVQPIVQQAVAAEPRMAASLLRLHFHDCFVNGCDGSVLLDGEDGEKFALPNNRSLRGFKVIDSIKAAVESACEGSVSCADILALAARDSVVLAGGPSWTVPLGRRDSTKANQSTANNALPGPFEKLTTIVAKFQAVGLTSKDVAVLSGAHTIGRAHCSLFITRLYNFSGTGHPDPTLNPAYLRKLRKVCPQGKNPHHLAQLDPDTPDAFDNKYYLNLKNHRGLFQSDQELLSTSYVKSFANDGDIFFTEFAESMIRMGKISSLTGTAGEIRFNCRVPNT